MKWQRRNIAPPLQGRGWGGAADETEFVRQLYARAAKLRRNPTPFEVIVWKYLSRSQLSGFKFRRQHVIVPFIVDFFCPGKGLAIEIDGRTHEYEKDRARDAQLAKAGVKTLHFTNEDVARNIEGVVATIQNALDNSPYRWDEQPHPNPSPEGEGL
ncbi:MAG: endonuclease domain-containing protein [Sphingorhabdus sp.]